MTNRLIRFIKEKKVDILAYVVATGLFIPIMGLVSIGIDKIVYNRYHIGNNSIRVEKDGECPLTGSYCPGETKIRYTDGTSTNFPVAMNKRDIETTLLQNSEHSKLPLESIQ